MKNLIQAACFLALVCSWADTANAQRYKTPYKTQTGYNSGSYGWEGSNDPFHSDLGSTSMDVVIHDKEELKMAFAQQALLQKQGDKTFYQSLYVSARTRGESHTHHTTDHHHYGTVDYKHSGTVSHHHSGTVNYSKPIGTYRLSCGAKRQVYPAPGGGYRFYNKRWYYSRSWSYWNYSYFYRF